MRTLNLKEVVLSIATLLLVLSSVVFLFNTQTKAVEGAAGMSDAADRAAEMNDELISQKIDGFGGIWVDPNTGRIKVGVAAGSGRVSDTKEAINRSISAHELEGYSDYVNVKYEFNELLEKKTALFNELKTVFKKNLGTITISIATDENKVVLEVPSRNSRTTAEERSIIQSYTSRYEDMIRVDRLDADLSPASCNWWFCGSPLRGGVEVISDIGGGVSLHCTAGFGVMGNSGAKYILTAGHCADGGVNNTINWVGDYWYTKDYNYNQQNIGDVHGNLLRDGDGIDGMIIETDDIGSWTAVGKIYVRAGVGLGGFSGPSTDEDYDITAYTTSGSLVGDRVCFSGQKSADLNNYEGGSCGPVVQVESSALQTKYGPVDGLVKARLCGRHGDSGGPVFRTGKALGVLSFLFESQNDASSCDLAAPYDGSRPGTVYYTGVKPIVEGFNNTIDIY